MKTLKPNDLSSYWVASTPNKDFKKDPRIVVSANGMYYKSIDSRDIMDFTSGLWCVNAGHNRPLIVKAVQQKVAELDYSPSMQFSNPDSFVLASRLADMFPDPLNKVFFANSGSEAVDTALKISMAYRHAKGEANKFRLIGRERAYHGVGFGGISVGGILPIRKNFHHLHGVDHLRHTHDIKKNAFSRKEPEHGKELADDLEGLVNLHGASAISAVIVEPVAGSTGVLPPPVGYLKRLREICDRHDILLIFDEVITAFGRLGKKNACEYFGVVPDIITFAKGVTNGVIPMGGAVASDKIYNTIVDSVDGGIEFAHGYTYSGHPVAVAAALATLDTYEQDDLYSYADKISPYFEDAMHSLKSLSCVLDIRNIGLMAGFDLEPIKGKPGARGYEVMKEAWKKGVMLRVTGDTIACCPPLIVEKQHIDQAVETISSVLKSI